MKLSSLANDGMERKKKFLLTYYPTTRLGLQNLSPIFKRARMVRYVYVDMVEDIISIFFWIFTRNDACILRISILINVAAHGKSGSAILLTRLNGVTPGDLRGFVSMYNIPHIILLDSPACCLRSNDVGNSFPFLFSIEKVFSYCQHSWHHKSSCTKSCIYHYRA